MPNPFGPRRYPRRRAPAQARLANHFGRSQCRARGPSDLTSVTGSVIPSPDRVSTGFTPENRPTGAGRRTDPHTDSGATLGRFPDPLCRRRPADPRPGGSRLLLSPAFWLPELPFPGPLRAVAWRARPTGSTPAGAAHTARNPTSAAFRSDRRQDLWRRRCSLLAATDRLVGRRRRCGADYPGARSLRSSGLANSLRHGLLPGRGSPRRNEPSVRAVAVLLIAGAVRRAAIAGGERCSGCRDLLTVVTGAAYLRAGLRRMDVVTERSAFRSPSPDAERSKSAAFLALAGGVGRLQHSGPTRWNWRRWRKASACISSTSAPPAKPDHRRAS